MKTIALSKLLVAGMLAVALLAGGLANAQVATTNLSSHAARILGPFIPGINGSEITPDNPAALGFIEHSMVAVGKVDGEDYDNLASKVNSSFDGVYAGGRYMGDGFALALDWYSLGETPPTKDDTTLNLQGAFRFGDTVSLGLGYETSDVDNGLGNSANMTTITLGASLKFGELLYAGFAVGKGTYDQSPSGTSGDRSVTQYGLGLKSEKNDNFRWYAEYYVVDLGDIDDPNNPGGFIGPSGLVMTGISMQAVFSNILVGYTTYDLEQAQTPTTKISGSTIDLGYKPMDGWSVVLRLLSVNITDTGKDATIDTTSISVAMTF